MAFDKDEFKMSIPLVDFIQTHYPQINLKEKGQEWFMTCPFCDDVNPSCVINQNKKNVPQFHCFQGGCNFDIFDLVAHQEGLDVKLNFKEVVTIIAQKTGKNVKFSTPNPFYEDFKKRKTILMNDYHRALLTSVDELDYLKKRGLTEETIKDFKLGLKSCSESKSIESNRIVFPIFEGVRQEKARCVGMCYRYIGSVPDGLNIPKYRNDANQVGDMEKGQDPNVAGVFIKGNFLYGYSHNMVEIKKQQEVFLVEGYMDVISLYQANIKQAVSIMGTSLTDEQVKLLKVLTPNVTLLLDSDKAGQKAMRKALPTLLKEGFNVSIIDFKNGQDPADICLARGFKESTIRNLFDQHRENAVSYTIRAMIKDYQDVVLPLRSKVLRDCEEIISYIKDTYERETYRRFIRHELDLS